MRIALVSEKLPEHHDPIGSIVLHLVEHLEAHGNSCLLMTSEGTTLLMGRTRVISLGDGKRETDLVETLNNVRPDLLHAIHPIQLGVQALGVAEEMGIPTIASYHSEFFDLARQWGFGLTGELMWSYFRLLHDLSSLTLVPSFINKMQLRDLGFNHVETWGRGVDTDLFSPRRRSEAWRRHLSEGQPNKTLLVYAGRLASDKHVELLLPIINTNPNCRLAIVGDGAERRWLRDYFEGTPTMFTGKLDQGDLAEVYASADLFVHPASNRISPVTTLEAMASGLPVLAPHSGAIVDFAVHGENALLYLPGETEQAANYVQELADKPGLRTDLGRIARQTALGRSWHMTLDQLIDRYSNVLNHQISVFPFHNDQVNALQTPQPIA